MNELLNILVVAPEIPPNTGNIIRLCSNSGCNLHLIKPIGFNFDNKSLKRARLDYDHNCNILIYDSYEEYIEKNNPITIYATQAIFLTIQTYCKCLVILKRKHEPLLLPVRS